MNQSAELSYDELRCKALNDLIGNMAELDCPICNNKGFVYFLDNGEIRARHCTCMAKRELIRRMEKSGLGGMLDKCTFDNFQTPESWQKQIKAGAEDYCQKRDGWFFIGGAVGCGKTHICTAIVGKLLEQTESSRYMLWRDEAVKLKGMVNEDGYEARITELKKTPILYIDDFLKTRRGAEVTDGDINLAFEIINNRYNSGAITIISSEKTIDEIIAIDEAIGSRIDQQSRNHTFAIQPGAGRNWRLK